MPDSPGDQHGPAVPQPILSEPVLPEPSTAPGPRPNTKVVKAVLITAGIFVGLGVLGAGALGFVTWYFSRSIHNVPSASFTESDLGIAIYPGAEPSLRGSRGEFAGKAMLSATYFTRDSAGQVIAFYKEKAGSDAHITTTSHGTGIRLSRAKGDMTTVQVMSVPSGSGDLTYIKIMRVTEAAGPH